MYTEKQPRSRRDILRCLLRLCIYCAGVVVVSLGIVLCVKSDLGISPISSIPYVIGLITPLSFGTLTMLFHLANSLIQYILERKLFNPRIILQVPVAILFGVVIDALQSLIKIDTSVLLFQCLSLVGSVFFTALGMVMMINMDLVQNPPDGTVRLVGRLLNTEIGKIKICYDIFCVLVSLTIGLISLRRAAGFGVATIFSAIFVGRTLSWLGGVGTFLRKRLGLPSP